MDVIVERHPDFRLELRDAPELTGIPIHASDVTPDLGDLVAEAFETGVLQEKIPPEPDLVRASIVPIWSREPFVASIEVRLEAETNGGRWDLAQRFESGRWVRSAQRTLLQLREEGSLAPKAKAYRVLVAETSAGNSPLNPLPLEAPPIHSCSLGDLGIREILPGGVVPDRPVLVSQILADDAVRMCEEAGTTETGGAVLGKLVRLPAALPETETRVVTILSAIVLDPRHEGERLAFHYHSEALAHASHIAEMRGLGESVVSVFHTHGWNPECARCNTSATCLLPQSDPSLQDYILLESMFASKTTLLPIAGRMLGSRRKRPVLQVHAWRSGELRPVRWRTYLDS